MEHDQELNNNFRGVKKKFVLDLVDKLNRISRDRLEYGSSALDVCYMTSIVDKQILQCEEFLKDISRGYFIEDYKEDPTGYTNGSIEIQCLNATKTYTLEFTESYCGDMAQCYPSFKLSERHGVGEYEWDYFEDDYEEYEANFNKKYSAIYKDIEQKKKERRIQDIKIQMEMLSQELTALES